MIIRSNFEVIRGTTAGSFGFPPQATFSSLRRRPFMSDKPPSPTLSGFNRRTFMATAAGTALAVPLTARAAGTAATSSMPQDPTLPVEVILKVNPLLLGEGIRVVAHLQQPARLRLIESKVYDNGVVLLAYRVLPTGV